MERRPNYLGIALATATVIVVLGAAAFGFSAVGGCGTDSRSSKRAVAAGEDAVRQARAAHHQTKQALRLTKDALAAGEEWKARYYRLRQKYILETGRLPYGSR